MSHPHAAPAPDGGPGVTGLVPAAGASTRMGEPKGLLELEGRSFVRRVVETLREGGCDTVVVTVRVDDADLEDEALRAGAKVLRNPDPGAGPITSLRLALERLSPEVGHVVWLPLDHPAVSSATVRALIDAARAGEATVTLPIHRGERGHPAVFARSLFAALRDPDVQGGARTVVHRCLEDGTARLVETDDPGVLVDVDTPDEYRALLSRRENG